MAFSATAKSTSSQDAGRNRTGRRIFMAICAFLVTVLLVEHAVRLQRIGFTTHDDFLIDLSAQKARAGLSAAWTEARGAASVQGRVGYLTAYFVAIAPYLMSESPRAALTAGVHFLSIAAACAFLAIYTGPALAVLAMTLVYALLPHWWRFFPIGGYPILFHTNVLLFFVAAILQVSAIRLELPRWKAWLLRAPSLVLLSLALTIYEAPDAIFAAILALMLAGEWRGVSPARRRRIRIAAASFVAVFVFYGAIYVAYRHLHPSNYVGNQFTGAALNFRAMAFAGVVYAAGALPLAQFYLQSALVHLFSEHSLPALGLLSFWLRSLTGLGVVKAALLAAAAVCFLRYVDVPDGLRRRALGIGAAACGLALLVHAPLVIVLRYQQDPVSKTPYVTGYYSYLCLMVALACAFTVAAGLLPRLGSAVRTAAMLAAGGFLFLVAATTQVANDAIIRSQERHSVTWRLVNHFTRSEQFRNLPESAVIVAPTLWDEIDPAWPCYENYWQEYFTGHTGRRIRVVRRFPEAAAPAQFYLDIQHPPGLGRPVLLFHDMAPGSPRLAQSTQVLSAHDLKAAALRYLMQPEGLSGAPAGVGRLETVPLPACSYRHGAYVTGIASPRLIAGTVTVESAETAAASRRAAAEAAAEAAPVP